MNIYAFKLRPICINSFFIFISSMAIFNCHKNDPYNKLILAIVENDITTVKKILKTGINVNVQDIFGYSPLQSACLNGNSQIVEELIKAGADVNVENDTPSPLFQAVSRDSTEIAKLLINHGADINYKIIATNAPAEIYSKRISSIYEGLLHVAAEKGSVEMIELLIFNGADVNAGNYKPLYFAIKEGKHAAVKLLIEKGADSKLKNGDGKSSSDFALETGNTNINQIITAGAIK